MVWVGLSWNMVASAPFARAQHLLSSHSHTRTALSRMAVALVERACFELTALRVQETLWCRLASPALHVVCCRSMYLGMPAKHKTEAAWGIVHATDVHAAGRERAVVCVHVLVAPRPHVRG